MGGHFQYFENRGTELVPETIESLRFLGAMQLAEVLSEALEIASGRAWGKISSVEQFIEESKSSGFEALDNAFHECAPTAIEILQKHLDSNRDQYVEIIPDTD